MLGKDHKIWKVYSNHSVISNCSLLSYAGATIDREDALKHIRGVFKETNTSYVVIENDEIVFKSRYIHEETVRKIQIIHQSNKYDPAVAERIINQMDIFK